MEYYSSFWAPTDSLSHHGILGMKWGVRRYQNADGSLTAAGQKRYYGSANKIQKDIDSFKGLEKGIYDKKGRTLLSETDVRNSVKGLEIARDKAKQKGDLKREKDKKRLDKYNQEKSADNNERKERIKKAAKIGAAVAGTALVAYGVYKLNKMATDELKAGDLYIAANKERWAGMHLNNYLTQMEIAVNYRDTSRLKGTFDPQKYRRMVETANAAASRSTEASKEARALLARRDSGNYSLRDKAEVISKMIRKR